MLGDGLHANALVTNTVSQHVTPLNLLYLYCSRRDGQFQLEVSYLPQARPPNVLKHTQHTPPDTITGDR